MIMLSICSYYTCTQNGWSPLMYASENGHVTVVAELLSHGANVELCSHKVLELLLSVHKSSSLHVN